MANVNLSLDDIIKTKRGGPKKGSRVGRSLPGFKRPLAGRRDKYFSDVSSNLILVYYTLYHFLGYSFG